MSKKHAHDVDAGEVETVEQEAAEAFGDSDESFESGNVDETGQITLTIGAVTFTAPDKYLEGHVMTLDEAVHYSNFVRSRCSSNMISMEKRGKKTWDAASAEEYYASYVLGAPRGRGPSEETILDEALDMLLDELAIKTGNALPAGKGSKAKIGELKTAIQGLAKYQPRIAELQEEVRAAYLDKAAAKASGAEKPPTFTVDSLFAD